MGLIVGKKKKLPNLKENLKAVSRSELVCAWEMLRVKLMKHYSSRTSAVSRYLTVKYKKVASKLSILFLRYPDVGDHHFAGNLAAAVDLTDFHRQ